MNPNDAVPDGYMKDPAGRLVPVEMVREIDKMRDQLVRELVLSARDVNAMLRHYKTAAFTDIAAFVQLSAEQYDAKVGGDKGNVTLFTFDGQYKIVRQVSETLRFDERLQAAKAKIDECITEWASNARPEIKVLVNDAFAVNKEGAVQTDRVLSLRRLDIKDEKWLLAMDAISESLQVVGSRSYVRVYERVGDTDRYQAIPLDLASV
jgi:hypothetical protein